MIQGNIGSSILPASPNYEFIIMDYKRKIDFAIKLLRSIPKDGQIEVSYSGGKDSDVILELAKMAGIDYRAIYKQTGIDPSGTIQHAREMGAEVLRPKMSFYEIICKMGWPNMFTRFCCKSTSVETARCWHETHLETEYASVWYDCDSSD